MHIQNNSGRSKWLQMRKHKPNQSVKMFCLRTTWAQPGRDTPLPKLNMRLSIRPYGSIQMSTGIIAPADSVKDGRVKVPDGDEFMAAIRKECDEMEVNAYKVFMSMKTDTYCPTPREVADRLRSKGANISITNSFTKVVEEFRESKRGEWAENSFISLKSALAALKRFIKSEFYAEEILLHEINHKFLTRFQLWLKRCGNVNGKGLSGNSTRLYVIRLTEILEYAFMCDYISENPCEKFHLTAPKAENAPDQLDRKVSVEAQLILENNPILEDPRLERIRLLMMLQMWTGLSYSDLEKYQVKNLIYTSLSASSVKEIRYNRVKTGELAILPLFEEAKVILDKLEWNNNPGPYKSYLRSVQNVFAHFNIIMDDRDGTHVPRHLFGNRMLEKGFSMESVSRMMGHKSIRITEKVYAKVNSDKIQADYKYVEKRKSM